MPTVRPRTTLYLWEFLLQLLDGEDCTAISWVNRDKGEFVLKDQGEIAKLWGKVKGRPRMDKIKLGRAMRYYYKKKLLAKVPRRKAVYRFVKFGALKQTEPQTKREEFPEIDFSDSNILDLIEDEQNEERPLPGLNIEDDNDLPLESLLADKRESVFQNMECQKLFPMETNIFYNRDNSGSNICNRFIDYANILEEDTSSFYGENTFSDIKNEQFEGEDYLHNSLLNTNVDVSYNNNSDNNNNNNNEPSSFDGSSYFASLLVKSMLIGEEQSMIDQMNPKENYNLSQPTCGYPTNQNIHCHESFTTLSDSPVKAEIENHSVTPFGHFNDIDTDTALSALKEFERLIMLNKLIDL